MEAGSSSNPFRRAKLPSSSFGSFGSLMPEGERIALEGLCNLMRSVAPPELLSEVPSVDEVIDCFLVFSGDDAGKQDRSKQALELALIAAALLNFKASLLQPFQQQAGAATNSSSTASAPTARQIQILSWENDSFTKAHRRVGEVQNTLRMLSNDLTVHKHSSRSGRISRRRRVIQLFDQTLEILSPHVASLADRIKSYIHGAHKEEEDIGGISEDEEDVLECKNDPDAKKRPGDRGFAVRSALERMMQGSRRRALRICEHLSEIRDRLCDEAMNLPDLTTEERGQRMELHRRIGEAVAAEDSQTLKNAIRAIRESCLCPEVSRELRLMEIPDPLANQETS